MTTWAEAKTARTKDEILEDMLVDLAAAGVPTDAWEPTTDARALVEVEATAQAKTEKIRASVAQAGFLSSRGDWQDATGSGFFDLARAPATKTVGILEITEAGGGPLTNRSARTVRAVSDTGQYFVNRDAFSVGTGQTIEVTFLAEVAGSSGNVANGSITTFQTSLPGYTCNNPDQGTGSWITTPGANAEGDDDYEQRMRDQWSTIGAGGNAAAVRARVGAYDATLTRIFVDDANPNGAGSVDVYIATALATATVEQVAGALAYLTPLKAVGTGPLRVFAAPVYTQSVVATLTTDGSNGTAAADAAQALADLEASFTDLGGTLYPAAIVAALMGVDGAVNAVVTTPAAPVVLGQADLLDLDPILTVT
jgi:hypothetical protein